MTDDDIAEIRYWAEFFAPFVSDDNEWYYSGEFDGKDAQELGQLFARLVAFIDGLVADIEHV